MNIEELKRRELRDGVICVLDSCTSKLSKTFGCEGEFCSECPSGFFPQSLDQEETINEINLQRAKNSNAPLS